MCGILGYVSKTGSASQKIMLGLFAEQHRGQESCGMAISQGRTIQLYKEMGLVKEVFSQSVLDKLPGLAGIGHVRYPTKGKSSEVNSQPHLIRTLFGPCFALASNGDIINYNSERGYLEDHGVYFESDNDGELLARYIAYHIIRMDYKPEVAIAKALNHIEGAYSTIFLTPNKLYAFRDPWGFRPISIGQVDGIGWAVASETCALDILNARNIREVEPGEIIEIEADRIRTYDPAKIGYPLKQVPKQHCIFELIYFARPDSYEYGQYVWEVQKAIGAKLAEQDEDLKVDVVVSIPDSSNFMALGYAQAKHIPFDMGLIRNHYVGRTFIKPEQMIRDEAVTQKFNPLRGYFKGKRVVVVDDSIVRGTTVRKLVHELKKTEAREIHLRIGSPPVRFPCYYGIDTPTCEELIANREDIAGMRRFIGASSLRYLRIDELKSCVKHPEDFCCACFDGKYIMKPDRERDSCSD